MEILFGETDFPWIAQAILSGFSWFDVRWQKCMKKKQWAKNLLFGVVSMSEVSGTMSSSSEVISNVSLRIIGIFDLKDPKTFGDIEIWS